MNGRLAQVDTPARVLSAPLNEDVASFFHRRRRRPLD